MKAPGQIFSLLAGLLLVNCGAYAAPMYYTFNGTVTSFDDRAGIIADTYDTSTFVGHDVEYVFIVDLEADGKVIRVDGEVVTLSDEANSAVSWDYFYTKGLSENLIQEKDGGWPFFNQPHAQGELLYGWNWTSDDSIDGVLFAGSDNSGLSIKKDSAYVQDWMIGDTMTGFGGAYDSLGQLSSYDLTLTLTDISPVPVPAAAWLFGSALLGLAVVKRKKA